MRHALIIVMFGVIGLGAAISRATAGQDSGVELPSQFLAPPESARPWVYWFWLNGNITRQGITADLEAMKRVGIGGVLIMEVDQGVPVGPVAFMSPQWRELFKHVVAESRRLGLEVNMNNDAGWNGSGGPWIKPEQSMQHVVWSETKLEGGRHFEGLLPRPPATADFYRDIAVFAVPTLADKRIEDIENKRGDPKGPIVATPNSPGVSEAIRAGSIPRDGVVTLTERMNREGRLVWDAPPGQWTVLRMGHTITGAKNTPAPASGCGWECDKLSKEGIEAQFAGMMDKLINDCGVKAGETSGLVATHIDSWENGSQNWTARMPEEFQKRRGYDMLRFLPVMTGRVVDNLEVSERFLWDLRQTISDLVVENYAGHLRELAKQRGLRLSIEAYGGPCNDLTYAGRADEPMCEFWVNSDWGWITVKAMASAAHTYGKNIIGAESFTALTGNARWTNHPFSLKAMGDEAFCQGVNRFVFHRYAHQPWLDRKPGMTMGPWGVHYERTETWWEQTRPWHEYLARCNHLLRQGLFVADICRLQAEGSSNGLNQGDQSAYGYDYCSPEVLLTRMKVQDGRLVLPDGMSYRLLVLPTSETMTPILLGKIKDLVEAGAIVIGPRPRKSPSLSDYPKCDDQVQKLAAELWGDCDGKNITEHRLGKGKIVWGKTPEVVLAEMGIPRDFRGISSTGQANLSYIHRTVGQTDLFFVANGSPQPLDVQCTFRVKGKRPEFWRPDTGRIEQVAACDDVSDGTKIPIWFDASGSLFVVFRPDVSAKSDRAIALSRDGKPVLGYSAQPAVEIVVNKAVYGVPGDTAHTRDVTAQVRQLVAQGKYDFLTASLAQSGDPAPNVVKTLTVDYTANGKSNSVSATDGMMCRLYCSSEPRDADIQYGDDGHLRVEAWKPGHYEVKTSSGRTGRVEVPALPQPIEVAGPWKLSFPPNSGVPGQVTLDKLISWSEYPDAGVKYFSGTATYAKTLQIPSTLLGKDRRIYLDLGRVGVIAEVKLNEKNLGILWKPPFRLDVTNIIKAGDNVLEIQVVNLWPNRLIGDEQLPDDSKRRKQSQDQWSPAGNLLEWPQWLLEDKSSPTGRQTFSTWQLWKKDDPLLESGLLGPVKLLTTECIPCQF